MHKTNKIIFLIGIISSLLITGSTLAHGPEETYKPLCTQTHAVNWFLLSAPCNPASPPDISGGIISDKENRGPNNFPNGLCYPSFNNYTDMIDREFLKSSGTEIGMDPYGSNPPIFRDERNFFQAAKVRGDGEFYWEDFSDNITVDEGDEIKFMIYVHNNGDPCFNDGIEFKDSNGNIIEKPLPWNTTSHNTKVNVRSTQIQTQGDDFLLNLSSANELTASIWSDDARNAKGIIAPIENSVTLTPQSGKNIKLEIVDESVYYTDYNNSWLDYNNHDILPATDLFRVNGTPLKTYDGENIKGGGTADYYACEPYIGLVEFTLKAQVEKPVCDYIVGQLNESVEINGEKAYRLTAKDIVFTDLKIPEGAKLIWTADNGNFYKDANSAAQAGLIETEAKNGTSVYYSGTGPVKMGLIGIPDNINNFEDCVYEFEIPTEPNICQILDAEYDPAPVEINGQQAYRLYIKDLNFTKNIPSVEPHKAYAQWIAENGNGNFYTSVTSKNPIAVTATTEAKVGQEIWYVGTDPVIVGLIGIPDEEARPYEGECLDRLSPPPIIEDKKCEVLRVDRQEKIIAGTYTFFKAYAKDTEGNPFDSKITYTVDPGYGEFSLTPFENVPGNPSIPYIESMILQQFEKIDLTLKDYGTASVLDFLEANPAYTPLDAEPEMYEDSGTISGSNIETPEAINEIFNLQAVIGLNKESITVPQGTTVYFHAKKGGANVVHAFAQDDDTNTCKRDFSIEEIPIITLPAICEILNINHFQEIFTNRISKFNAKALDNKGKVFNGKITYSVKEGYGMFYNYKPEGYMDNDAAFVTEFDAAETIDIPSGGFCTEEGLVIPGYAIPLYDENLTASDAIGTVMSILSGNTQEMKKEYYIKKHTEVKAADKIHLNELETKNTLDEARPLKIKNIAKTDVLALSIEENSATANTTANKSGTAITVNPGEEVYFVGLKEGDDVITVSTDCTDKAGCIRKFDITLSPEELRTCKAFDFKVIGSGNKQVTCLDDGQYGLIFQPYADTAKAEKIGKFAMKVKWATTDPDGMFYEGSILAAKAVSGIEPDPADGKKGVHIGSDWVIYIGGGKVSAELVQLDGKIYDGPSCKAKIGPCENECDTLDLTSIPVEPLKVSEAASLYVEAFDTNGNKMPGSTRLTWRTDTGGAFNKTGLEPPSIHQINTLLSETPILFSGSQMAGWIQVAVDKTDPLYSPACTDWIKVNPIVPQMVCNDLFVTNYEKPLEYLEPGTLYKLQASADYTPEYSGYVTYFSTQGLFFVPENVNPDPDTPPELISPEFDTDEKPPSLGKFIADNEPGDTDEVPPSLGPYIATLIEDELPPSLSGTVNFTTINSKDETPPTLSNTVQIIIVDEKPPKLTGSDKTINETPPKLVGNVPITLADEYPPYIDSPEEYQAFKKAYGDEVPPMLKGNVNIITANNWDEVPPRLIGGQTEIVIINNKNNTDTSVKYATDLAIKTYINNALGTLTNQWTNYVTVPEGTVVYYYTFTDAQGEDALIVQATGRSEIACIETFDIRLKEIPCQTIAVNFDPKPFNPQGNTLIWVTEGNYGDFKGNFLFSVAPTSTTGGFRLPNETITVKSREFSISEAANGIIYSGGNTGDTINIEAVGELQGTNCNYQFTDQPTGVKCIDLKIIDPTTDEIEDLDDDSERFKIEVTTSPAGYVNNFRYKWEASQTGEDPEWEKGTITSASSDANPFVNYLEDIDTNKDLEVSVYAIDDNGNKIPECSDNEDYDTEDSQDDSDIEKLIYDQRDREWKSTINLGGKKTENTWLSGNDQEVTYAAIFEPNDAQSAEIWEDDFSNGRIKASNTNKGSFDFLDMAIMVEPKTGKDYVIYKTDGFDEDRFNDNLDDLGLNSNKFSDYEDHDEDLDFFEDEYDCSGQNSKVCIDESDFDDIYEAFRDGDKIKISNTEKADKIIFIYQVENNTAVTDEFCRTMIEKYGSCGEEFKNTIRFESYEDDDFDNSLNTGDDNAEAIVICPYILTREGGDVFFHSAIETGIDVSQCYEVESGEGIGITLTKDIESTVPSTGQDTEIPEASQVLSQPTHDICKLSNTEQENLESYSNVLKNFSSSVCEIKADVAREWKERFINEAIKANIEKIARFDSLNGGTITGMLDVQNKFLDKNLSSGVYVFEGDVTIAGGNDGNFIIKEANGVPAAQTYIVKNANLNITANIKYDDSADSVDITDPGSIPSAAFIVIDGNINISNSVTEIDGILMAVDTEGEVDGKVLPKELAEELSAQQLINYLAGSNNLIDTALEFTNTLTIRGSLIGDVYNLFYYRRAIGDPYKDQGSITIRYDERILLNTPPGLNELIDVNQLRVAE